MSWPHMGGKGGEGRRSCVSGQAERRQYIPLTECVCVCVCGGRVGTCQNSDTLNVMTGSLLEEEAAAPAFISAGRASAIGIEMK